MRSGQSFGHIAAFLTIMIWGTTFISTKVLLEVLTPVEILFYRFVIGYLALWLVYPKPLKVKENNHEWYFAAAGLCGITLYYLLENIALTYTQASNVGVIISIAPFFTVIFACLFLREKRPSFLFFVGFVVAIVGISCISFQNQEGVNINFKGDVLAMLAAIVWAGYSTIVKKISSFQYPTIPCTRRTFFYGLLFMIPALSLFEFQLSLQDIQQTNAVFNLIFLGLGASALCFVTWNRAVEILGSVKTSVYIYMVPVITTCTSAMILQETITSSMVIGMVLTLCGLFLSQVQGRQKKEKK